MEVGRLLKTVRYIEQARLGQVVADQLHTHRHMTRTKTYWQTHARQTSQ
jgi:hypothetical protein